VLIQNVMFTLCWNQGRVGDLLLVWLLPQDEGAGDGADGVEAAGSCWLDSGALSSSAAQPLACNTPRTAHLWEGTLPYLTLPSGEDVLPPSAEASNGPSAHPRINHEVTKSPSVASTHLGPQ